MPGRSLSWMWTERTTERPLLTCFANTRIFAACFLTFKNSWALAEDFTSFGLACVLPYSAGGTMSERTKRWARWVATALVLGAAAIFVWQRYGAKHDEGLDSGNGRMEATEIDVAAKIPGRIKEVL